LPISNIPEIQKSLATKENINDYMTCTEEEKIIIYEQPENEQPENEQSENEQSENKPINEITSSPKFEISLEVPKLSRDIVTKNLTEISKLCEYQKLWLDGDVFTIDNSWAPSIARWSYGQSKETIIPQIAETVNCGVIYVMSDCENQSIIKNLLMSSINGLKNLIITYPSKKDQLNEIILKIEQTKFL
jgi:hypothetical protein